MPWVTPSAFPLFPFILTAPLPVPPHPPPRLLRDGEGYIILWKSDELATQSGWGWKRSNGASGRRGGGGQGKAGEGQGAWFPNEVEYASYASVTSEAKRDALIQHV